MASLSENASAASLQANATAAQKSAANAPSDSAPSSPTTAAVAKLSAEDFSEAFNRLSIESIPQLNKIFDALVAEMPVSAGKKSSTSERNKLKDSRSTLVYGEIAFASYAIAMEKVKNKYGGLQESGGIFFDLGHGTGKPALAAALLHDFDSVNGIELLDGLYNLSLQLKSIWMEKIHCLLPDTKQRTEVHFMQGDITVEDWSHATMCFANSTCFDDPLMKKLADKAELMASGTLTARVVGLLLVVVSNSCVYFVSSIVLLQAPFSLHLLKNYPLIYGKCWNTKAIKCRGDRRLFIFKGNCKWEGALGWGKGIWGRAKKRCPAIKIDCNTRCKRCLSVSKMYTFRRGEKRDHRVGVFFNW